MALQVIRDLESSVLYCFVSSFLSQSNKCLRRVCPKGNIPRSSAHFTANQWSQNNMSLLQTYACQFLSSLQPKWWLKLVTRSAVSLMLSPVLFCSYLTTSVRHIPQMPLFPNDSRSVHMTLWFSNSTWEHSPFSSVLCPWNTAPQPAYSQWHWSHGNLYQLTCNNSAYQSQPCSQAQLLTMPSISGSLTHFW